MCPIATKAPPTSSSSVSPVSALRSRTWPSLPSSPATNSSGTNGVLKLMLSWSRARSCMIFEARNSSRRWTMVSSLANFEMKIESSIAESPPPITTTSSPLKKAPSQTPQVETPLPPSSISPGTPRRFGSAPIARITRLGEVLVVADPDALDAAVGELDPGGVVGDEAGAEALRLIAELLHQLRAHDPLGEARVVLDVGRVLKLAAPLEALDHERLELGAGGVERGRVAGGGPADDDHVLDSLCSFTFTRLLGLRFVGASLTRHHTLLSEVMAAAAERLADPLGDAAPGPAPPPSAPRSGAAGRRRRYPGGIGSQKAISR